MEQFYKMELSVSNPHMQIQFKILQFSIHLMSKEAFNYLKVIKTLQKTLLF